MVRPTSASIMKTVGLTCACASLPSDGGDQASAPRTLPAGSAMSSVCSPFAPTSTRSEARDQKVLAEARARRSSSKALLEDQKPRRVPAAAAKSLENGTTVPTATVGEPPLRRKHAGAGIIGDAVADQPVRQGREGWPKISDGGASTGSPLWTANRTPPTSSRRKAVSKKTGSIVDEVKVLLHEGLVDLAIDVAGGVVPFGVVAVGLLEAAGS